MPKFKLDDIEYNTEDLSEKGIAQLESIKFTDKKVKELEEEIFIYNAAKQSLLEKLKAEIDEK